MQRVLPHERLPTRGHESLGRVAESSFLTSLLEEYHWPLLQWYMPWCRSLLYGAVSAFMRAMAVTSKLHYICRE